MHHAMTIANAAGFSKSWLDLTSLAMAVVRAVDDVMPPKTL